MLSIDQRMVNMDIMRHLPDIVFEERFAEGKERNTAPPVRDSMGLTVGKVERSQNLFRLHCVQLLKIMGEHSCCN
jgi:hypothetical protein